MIFAEYLLTAAVACLLTLFDLDRTFYVPEKAQEKRKLWAWWWFFVLGNGVLAVLLYSLVKDLEAVKQMNPIVRALLAGGAYLTLVRLKLTTIKVEDKAVPLGLELIYEGAKEFVYKRINRIAKKARFSETMALAQASTLAALATQARLSISQDALLGPQQKQARKQWLLQALQQAQPGNDLNERIMLANYILSDELSE